MPTVNAKKLAGGQLSLFDTASQQLIIVPAPLVAQVEAAPTVNDGWSVALQLAQSGQAQLLNKSQLNAVHQATSYVVLLTGSNDWPP